MVAAACSSSPPPPPVSSRSAPPTVTRSTSAPTISWRDQNFEASELPAVARAGHLAVVALGDSDGGRGYPNLRLEVRDRNDAVIQKVAVMTSNEFETLAPDGKPSPGLTERIAAANRALETLHGLHDLVAMTTLELQPTQGDDLPHLAIGEGLDVEWAHHELRVFRHNMDRPFRTVSGLAWLAPSGKRCAQCDPCENPTFLEAVYKAPDVNLLVVEIGYRGTDTCWEPGEQFHVVTW